MNVSTTPSHPASIADRSAWTRAEQHPLLHDGPAPDFFEGAVLGNGALGTIVCTRPDAVLVHFAHNNVWDIRVAPHGAAPFGNFETIFARIQSLSKDGASCEGDPWYDAYLTAASQGYSQPFPRPFPCGTLLLGLDRRHTEPLGHRVDIARGLCEVLLLHDGERITLQLFLATDIDRLWFRTIDAAGTPCAAPFNRLRLISEKIYPPAFGTGSREQSAIASLPSPITVTDATNGLCFHQTLPFSPPTDTGNQPALPHPQDRAVRLAVRVNATLGGGSIAAWDGQLYPLDELERAIAEQPANTAGMADEAGFHGCVQLDEGLLCDLHPVAPDVPLPDANEFESSARQSEGHWCAFWERSAVALQDAALERTWYHNLYFLNCSMKPGVHCPGLFGNWSLGEIGAEWHGDYHMNYNTQQAFWATFSSNHVDKHLVYTELVESLLPVARSWAKEFYDLRGAYFPHSAYPAAMEAPPYPAPPWGWEICETPWTVQSLWWHYLYTQDEAYLCDRAFAPLKDASQFLVDFMHRPAARGGSGAPLPDDDHYHIFPTVSPELYGMSPGLVRNYDCLVDLTLTKFVFKAFLQSVTLLGRDDDERELCDGIHDVLAHFPEYPTAQSQRGKVWASVPGENPEIVYNTPNSLMTVFPGEEHGLESDESTREICLNTLRNHRNEGGNDLVFYNLQAARLGALDLKKFKRQIAYCLLPNGTCTDRLLETQGRYVDHLSFDFMARMGIWQENFALPAVINECLLQSYTGTLRLFPNWPHDKDAEFRTLRAVGAFLVSARIEQGVVQWVEIFSEKGRDLRLVNPYPGSVRVQRFATAQELQGDLLTLPTNANETLRLLPQ